MVGRGRIEVLLSGPLAPDPLQDWILRRPHSRGLPLVSGKRPARLKKRSALPDVPGLPICDALSRSPGLGACAKSHQPWAVSRV